MPSNNLRVTNPLILRLIYVFAQNLEAFKIFQTLRSPDPNQNVTDPRHWFGVLFYEVDIVHLTNMIF